MPQNSFDHLLPGAQPTIQPQPFPRPVPVIANPDKQIERDNTAQRLQNDNEANARGWQALSMEQQRLLQAQQKADAERKAREMNGGVETNASQDMAGGHAVMLEQNLRTLQSLDQGNPANLKPTWSEWAVGKVTDDQALNNKVRSAKRQVAVAAYNNILESAIYLSTGAAAPPDQVARIRETLEPTPGDGPELLRYKRGLLQTYIQQARERAGPAQVKVNNALNALESNLDKMYSSSEVPAEEPAKIVPSDRNVQAVEIPPAMQEENKQWLAQHPPGSLDVGTYLQFRRELDKKYNFGEQDYPDADKWVKAYNEGRVNITLPPAEKQLTGLSGMVAEASRDPGMLGDAVAFTKNFTNAATFGAPTAMADRFQKQASENADEAHWKSALAGDLMGSLLPVTGLEGAALRGLGGAAASTAGKVGADVGANAVYGGVRGFNEADQGQGLEGAAEGAAFGGGASLVGRAAVKGARGFMPEDTITKIEQFEKPQTFEIPGREPLMADAVTPPHFQGMSDDQLRNELEAAKRGLGVHAQVEQGTKVAQEQAQGIIAKAEEVAKSNANKQEQFVRENVRSLTSTPEDVAAIRAQAEKLYPTDPKAVLNTPEFMTQLRQIRAPSAAKLEPKAILEQRVARLEEHLAKPDTPGTGTIPAADPTTFQRIGATDAEESASRLPFVHGQRQKAIESWNVQNSGRALSNIGEELPKGLAAGQDMNAYVNRRLSAFYNKLAPRITGKIDRSFQNGYDAIMTKTASRGNITQEELQAIQAMKAARQKFLKPDGSYDAEGYRQFTTDLRSLAEDLNQAEGIGSARLRELARDVELLRKQGQALVGRNDPFAGKQLKRVERAWAHQARIELASRGAAKATRGVYSPDQYLSAIERADTSKGKTAVSRGRAFDQPYAQDAREVFGGTPPKMANSRDAVILGYAASNTGWLGKGLVAAGVAGYTPVIKRGIQALNAGKVGEAADMVLKVLPKEQQAKLKGLPAKTVQELLTQALRSYADKNLSTTKGN